MLVPWAGVDVVFWFGNEAGQSEKEGVKRSTASTRTRVLSLSKRSTGGSVEFTRFSYDSYRVTSDEDLSSRGLIFSRRTW